MKSRGFSGQTACRMKPDFTHRHSSSSDRPVSLAREQSARPIRAFYSNVFLRNHGLLHTERRIVNLPPFHFPFSIQPNGCAEAFSVKKMLLLNGGKKFAHSGGRYSTARKPLERVGSLAWCHQDHLHRRGGMTLLRNFVLKFLWADVIIYQMPGWWMKRRGR